MAKPVSDPNLFVIGRNKDTQKILQTIRIQVEKGTGKSISQLKQEYPEDKLFLLALQYVTTTKKAICEALDIPLEAACWAKRLLEKSGLLVQSTDEFLCPYTRHFAHLLSTNPGEFARLQKSSDTQQKLF